MPNVAVIADALKVPVPSAAVRTVTTPELALTPAAVAVQTRFASVPVNGATSALVVAVVLVNAVLVAAGATRNNVVLAVAVPVPTPKAPLAVVGIESLETEPVI